MSGVQLNSVSNQGNTNLGSHSYNVKSGDSLSTIAERNGVSLQSLIDANPQIRNPDRIYAGDRIQIPNGGSGAKSYTVQPGDTLGEIANKNNVSVQDLARVNNISNPDLIYPGAVLTIPKSSTGTGASTGSNNGSTSVNNGAANNGATAQPPTSSSAPSTAPATAAGKIPDTRGMTESQKFDLYSGYMNQFGSSAAKNDLASGKRVILGLRHDTNTATNRGQGAYDDRMVVMWQDSSGKHVREFKGATEGSAQYDPKSQFFRRAGGSSDANGDGVYDVPRLADGTYGFRKDYWSNGGQVQSNGQNILSGTTNQTVQRDSNHDGKWDKNDPGSRNLSGQDFGIYFHRGSDGGNTYSSGCQTIPQSEFNNFWKALGSQSNFNYTLVNESRLPASAGATSGNGSTGSTSGTGATSGSSGANNSSAAKPLSQMQSSDRGVALVKSYEGFFAKPYNDPAGHATIGYGHLLHRGNVTVADKQKWGTITEKQATDILKQDMRAAEAEVKKHVKVPLTQGQFDALVSFEFNTGGLMLKDGLSTLVKKLNAGDYAGAQKEFGRWVKADGQTLPGLVRRRAEEAAMFGSQPPSASAATSSNPGTTAPTSSQGTAAVGNGANNAGATPWMTTARQEEAKGVREINGGKSNPDIMKYHKSSGFWGKDDSGRDNAWCGSFVNWNVEGAGIKGPKDAFRAKEWASWGSAVSPKNAQYGDVVVIKSGSSYHVGFFAGKNADGSFKILGGNQSDGVNTKTYSASSVFAVRRPQD